MENHCLRVGRFNALHHAKCSALRALNDSRRTGNSVYYRLKREFHVRRSERTSVAELNSTMHMENVGLGVRSFPPVGEISANVHGRVAFQQSAEEQTTQLGGARVGTESGVEIGRHC